MTHADLETSQERARALEREPGVAMNWHLLGIAYAREGKVAELTTLCDRAAPLFGNRIRYFQNVAIDLAARREWRVFDGLAGALPADRLEGPIAQYYLACERIVAGDHGGALELLRVVKERLRARHADYPLKDDANMNILFRQATLPEALDETRRLLAQAGTVPPRPEIRRRAAAATPGVVVATSMDRRYFKRFGPPAFEGYAALGLQGPLHLHLIGPDRECLDLFETLCGKYPGLDVALSVEPDQPWHNPVYYTCARFAVAGALLDTYAAPLLFIDGDSVPTARPDAYLAGLGGAHFACIETDRDEPASVYQAGVMVFPDTAKTRALADMTARFALAKIATPPVLAWMLDQAALFSVLTLLLRTDPEFRFANLSATAPEVMKEPLRTLADPAEKSAIMNA